MTFVRADGRAGAEATDHAGFRIIPAPEKEPGGYRIGARIEKEVNGSTRTHQMIRADTYGDRETAIEASVQKAIQMIDQMGDRLFD